MSIFTGAGTALVTPFNDTGIDFAAFETLIEYQIENGIDALVVCGTTGEPSTMTREEKKAAIEFVVKHAAGRVPVIAGTGSNNTAASIEASMEASDLGVDGLLVVTPYYNKCSDAGLIKHFHSIADASSVPIIVYNVPARTGMNITPAVMKEISQHDRIVGIKEASANITQITEIARLCQGIDLYSGNDDHVIPVMSLGGKGVISVVSNVAPGMTHEMTASWLAGDTKKALELQFKLNPLIKALFIEVSPIPVKTALNMIGINAGVLRMPLCEMSADKAAILKKELIALGFDIA
ncbi:MAG: 4-hydroxy-tetrahydrodipicolinate synthase [Burkholderiales bacterium]